MEDKKYIECKNCEDLSCERECERRLNTMCMRVHPKDCIFKNAVILEQKLEKIKKEIGENKELRCSLDMGKKILQIIEGDNNE